MKSLNLLMWVLFVGNVWWVSPKVYSRELHVKELQCVERNDRSPGDDEIVLYVYVDGVFWNAFQDRSFEAGDSWQIDLRITFQQRVEIKVVEIDVSRNDVIGTVVISDHPSPQRTARLTQSRGEYLLTYSIMHEPAQPMPEYSLPRPREEGPGNGRPPSPEKMESMKQEFERFLTKYLAKGNQGRATVERFEFDGRVIKFKVRIKHRHSLGRSPFGGDLILYSFNTDFEGSFNPYDPISIANTSVCTNLPPVLGGHKVCVSLKDIAMLLAL